MFLTPSWVDPSISKARRARKPARRRITSTEPEETTRSYGARRVTAEDADVPSFYVVPMSGQMGTDVSLSVYEDMLDDIREHDSDYLIIHMQCRDTEDRLVSRIAQQDRGLDRADPEGAIGRRGDEEGQQRELRHLQRTVEGVEDRGEEGVRGGEVAAQPGLAPDLQ